MSRLVGEPLHHVGAQYYPQHWDHIPERIKIRMLLQMKYKTISKEIDKPTSNNNSIREEPLETKVKSQQEIVKTV